MAVGQVLMSRCRDIMMEMMTFTSLTPASRYRGSMHFPFLSNFSHSVDAAGDAQPIVPTPLAMINCGRPAFPAQSNVEQISIFSVCYDDDCRWEIAVSGDRRPRRIRTTFLKVDIAEETSRGEVDTDWDMEFARHGLSPNVLTSVCDLRIVIEYKHRKDFGRLPSSSLASLL